MQGFIVSFIAYFFGAGLAEELVKAIPIFILHYASKIFKKSKLAVREPLDGILLGAASGLGFTLLETLGQYVPNLVQQSIDTIRIYRSRRISRFAVINSPHCRVCFRTHGL